jgi:hypothetical protein
VRRVTEDLLASAENGEAKSLRPLQFQATRD